MKSLLRRWKEYSEELMNVENEEEENGLRTVIEAGSAKD